jgi:hypothetical protein
MEEGETIVAGQEIYLRKNKPVDKTEKFEYIFEE